MIENCSLFVYISRNWNIGRQLKICSSLQFLFFIIYLALWRYNLIKNDKIYLNDDFMIFKLPRYFINRFICSNIFQFIQFSIQFLNHFNRELTFYVYSTEKFRLKVKKNKNWEKWAARVKTKNIFPSVAKCEKIQKDMKKSDKIDRKCNKLRFITTAVFIIILC